mgnify:FL=1
MTYKEELKKTAEERAVTQKEVEANFTEWLQTQLGDLWKARGETLKGWPADDKLDVFRQYYSASARRGTSSGGSGETWVGMVVGYLGQSDNMRQQREKAVEASEVNLGNALKYGIVHNENNIAIGRVYYDNGNWVAVDGNDSRLHVEAGSQESPPNWAIPINSGVSYVCLLKQDRRPKVAYLWKRRWVVVVNTLDKFLEEGPRKTPLVLECSFDAAKTKLVMNVPISFKAEEGTAWQSDEVILEARNLDPNYGLDWVPESALSKANAMFSPDQFIAQFMPVCALEDFMDYHDKAENKISLRNGGEIGPIFAVMGEVDYINSDGKEDAYAEGGARHPIVLTNQNLRREDPSNSGVWVNLNASHVTDHNAHQVKKDDGWYDYQQGSRVWCVVQTRTWIGNQGDINYNMDGLNVYALPLRSIVSPRASSDTNDVGQFDDFGLEPAKDKWAGLP